MAEQRIEIRIGMDGKISAKTEGLKGNTCLEELQAFLVDEVPIQIKKTDEYYQSVDNRVNETQNLGRKK